MLTIANVSPTPISGQYWAWLNPLSLLRVEYGGDCPSFKLWQAGNESEQDLTIVAPLNDNFRLLRWFHLYTDEEISKDLGVDFKTRTGDVFEARSGMLVFAVLEQGGVTLYSDEQLTTCTDRLIDSVVQRGPGPNIDKAVKTRYERIIDEANANFPLVRSVGGILLRSKESSSVLLPGPNVRPKNQAITNLQLLQTTEQDRLDHTK